MNNKTILLGLVIAGILIAGAIVYTNYQKEETSTESQIIPSQEAADKLITFINNNILKGQAVASLVEVLEENGFYKIKFNVEDQEVEWQMSRDGKLVFPQVIDLTKEILEPAEEPGQTVGNFSISSDEVCKEDGKTIVYFFGSEGCPHCVWERPIIEEVAAKFGNNISFHNNMDGDKDNEVFDKYSTGGVPTLVLGCKYYRVGSGEGSGKEEEIKNLTSLICDLTDNQPAAVCQ